MKCFKCGSENKDEALFCYNCGSRLQFECPECHRVVPANYKFCCYCGNSLASGEEQLQEKLEQKHEIVTENQGEDKEHHSIVDFFSFRRVGSILVIGFSVLIIGLLISIADEFNGVLVIEILYYLTLLYCGIRGFNCESAKYGKIVAVMITISSLLFAFVAYSDNSYAYMMSKQKPSFIVLVFTYCIMMVPPIFMCITPRYLKTQLQDEDKILFFCKNCGTVSIGSSDIDSSDMNCPKCGNLTIKTDMTYHVWKTLTDSEEEDYKKIWSE